MRNLWAFFSVIIGFVLSIFYLKIKCKKDARKDIEIEQARKTLDVITEIKQDDESRMAGGIGDVNKRLHKDAVD